MILHTHDIDGHDHWVLHVSREEAVEITRSISGALESNPDNESFALTLGEVAHDEEDHEHVLIEEVDVPSE